MMKYPWKRLGLYGLAMVGGVCAGLSSSEWLFTLAHFCSEAFIRLFRCVSLPIISLSLIVALSRYGENRSLNAIWKRTLMYVLTTTLLAVTVSAILYYLIAPERVQVLTADTHVRTLVAGSYLKYLLQIIPDNALGIFIENQVLAVLVLSFMVGMAIRGIPDPVVRTHIQRFFEGLHSILSTIIRYIIAGLPLGLFGFIGVGIRGINASVALQGMGAYFLVVVLANILQGTLVLPLFLLWKHQNPLRVFKGMLPALSIAFFTKSSVGTLPVTLQQVEHKLGVKPQVGQFVLPLCTTINMNGCGTFIFTTVLYVMHNQGIEITLGMMLAWILIATLAAIGNAGVPMGCFFLSASLLSSMNVPVELMGMILPIYSVIDMLETALNVWSDSCVTLAVNHDMQMNSHACLSDC
ncbi:MAG TPA: dicarboxylate/amino acid:cation symporter [Opitutae bacterium]|nr:dicarboxylate/amino acid:cation symporter [Opitutae bacterium]